MYCLFFAVLCIVCVQMCTVLLPPGGYPIAVNKYIISCLHFMLEGVLYLYHYFYWGGVFDNRPGHHLTWLKSFKISMRPWANTGTVPRLHHDGCHSQYILKHSPYNWRCIVWDKTRLFQPLGSYPLYIQPPVARSRSHATPNTWVYLVFCFFCLETSLRPGRPWI
jgi:hypothetical protein